MFAKEKKTEASDIEAEPPEFPRDSMSGSGSVRGYTVEVRLMFNGHSRVVNGMALGPTWARVHFPEAPIGVPKGRFLGSLSDDVVPFMAYPSAQALRWWFIANAAMTHDDICLETRLVEHDLSYQHKDVETRAVEETKGSAHIGAENKGGD